MTDPKVDIAALAKLARLEISSDEMSRLETEIPEILGFVDVIQSANVGKEEGEAELRNVMRPDEGAHESGTHTKTLLTAAPSRDGDRFAVKQVISRKK